MPVISGLDSMEVEVYWWSKLCQISAPCCGSHVGTLCCEQTDALSTRAFVKAGELVCGYRKV